MILNKNIAVNFLTLLLGLVLKPAFSQQNFTQYVNPFVGTDGAGHTFPGAVLPFGMVQLSPDTRNDGSWEGCSGYHYKDSVIFGFSHKHLSGTGMSDWGDILITPMCGKPSADYKTYSSKFSHKNEKASPGFYKVMLNNDSIGVELTATLRTGIHRYTFPKNKKAFVILDLLHRDKTLNCNLRVLDSVTVSGFRVSQGWAKEQHEYFIMKFNKPFKSMGYSVNKTFKPKLSAWPLEKAEGAFFEFDSAGILPLIVKVALSPVNTDGALKNMAEEAPHWDFEKYKKNAEEVWNKQLSKIEVKGGDADKFTVFYTALYHCFIHPSISMDVDNRYRGINNEIQSASGYTNYTVFSLWDTYRALHPLFTMVERKRTVDFIQTFLNQYKLSKRLPVWELSSNETNCMIGFHAVSVITDALVKNIGGFDTLYAYEAAKASATYTDFGLPAFNKNFYLETNNDGESVSKTLEYGYDYWCLSQMATILKKPADILKYTKYAQAYKNLFDNETGFMRPRKNGNWLTPFFPTEINNHFTEANSWQYTFYVPQDIEGLINLYGGKQNFEKKLDELFSTSEKTTGREQADVTGLIGQYAHGNQPSHHMAYLYNFVGKPQKTIDLVHKICNNFYKNSPDGLIGNEDCGQMSAWYVFNAIGFYPFCPGSVQYVLSQPLFDHIKLNFEDGTHFDIENSHGENEVLCGYAIDKRKLKRSSFAHQQFFIGKQLSFIYLNKNDTLTKTENINFCKPPVSIIPTYSISNPHLSKPISSELKKKIEAHIPVNTMVAAPIIKSEEQLFKNSMDISIKAINYKEANIFYTTDGSNPSRASSIYFKPFKIDSSCTIKAKIYNGKDSSVVTEAKFYKLKHNYNLTLVSKPCGQYQDCGPYSLMDGLYGSLNWRTGHWMGFQDNYFECVIDLKNKKEISYIGLNCLQDSHSWILMPTQVNFYISDDTKNFKQIGVLENNIKPEDPEVIVAKFGKLLEKTVTARYIKITAKNYGTLPEWHQGKGGEALIFVDEIEIK